MARSSGGGSFIYGLCDPRTQALRYVGITNRLVDRYREHIREAQRGSTHADRWIKKLLDDGLMPDKFVIEEVDKDGRAEAECFWIAYFKSIGCQLTNITRGGEGVLGLNHSEETKKKMSESAKHRPSMSDATRHLIASISKGHRLSEEAKKKISIAHIGNKSGLGHHHKASEETRRKLRESHLGNGPSPETVIKIPNANRGKRRSAEIRLKMSIVQRKVRATQPKRHLSDETKAKMSESAKLVWARKRGSGQLDLGINTLNKD